jgi:RNA polymerase sigma-70 factor (ECF subfamily)
MDKDEATSLLLDRLRAGDHQALGELFAMHRERLGRMVQMRLDRRLYGRLAAEDILQDAFLDVARRFGEYVENPTVPVYVWLRFLTLQRLHQVQRRHLGAQMRDAGLEVTLNGQAGMSAHCESLAGELVGHFTSPSQAAMRDELRNQLLQALESMDPLDREVLALRHFEELGNNEVAAVLGISKDAASKRHVRALKRLRTLLEPYEMTDA